MVFHPTTILALASLLLLQAFGTLGFITGPVLAQESQQVMVIVGTYGLEECSVEFKSDIDGSDTWVADGDSEPCEGGHVWAYRTTQEQASQVSQEMLRSSSTAESEEVRIVPLTGNDAQDEDAVQTEVIAIHEMFETTASSSANGSDLALGYLAPGALTDAASRHLLPASSVLAAQCDKGRVGERKRLRVDFKAIRPDARVRTLILYERISCSNWEIQRLTTRLLDRPDHPVWFRIFEYERVRDVLGNFRWRAWTGCERLSETQDDVIPLDWVIKTGNKANIEVIDNDNFDYVCSGLGNSYSSDWFRLRGGSS